ncbi:DUF397 domain-containing protein [Streptomyces cinnamoneus]|uniref:DUF397 domain-containing protein n=1 Tax=Streptomyces cinnamoneus TaxID=53446 RepID=UPI000CEDD912|nr:DUF397 domain-containing protein [Streptomyces cinnamoneus]PPT14785.1 DUF397 domain-containing protein [Streptomyces cinnamoneus]
MDKSVLRSLDLSAAEWTKSKRSGGGANDQCVEVTKLYIDGVHVGMGMRDSTDPEGPVLYFWNAEYRAYQQGIADGQASLLVP